MCQRTPFLPIITAYMINKIQKIHLINQIDITRTTRSDNPLASSCIFSSASTWARAVSRTSTHCTSLSLIQKGLLWFRRVGDNNLIPHMQWSILRWGRCDRMDGWLDFHWISEHVRLFRWHHYSPRTPVIRPLAVDDDVFISWYIYKQTHKWRVNNH